MEFFKRKTAYGFMASRKMWYSLSAILILASLASLATRGLNLSIDFTGGVAVEAVFASDAKVEAVREALGAAGIADAQVKSFGSTRDIAIQLPPLPTGKDGAAVRAEVDAVLKKVDASAEIRRFDVVGPQVGSELMTSAVWSLSATLVLIFLYLVIRFHTWRLSVGATIAALHDPLLVFGFFSLTQLPFDLSVVAAILAVIGYSLNDTVVVFDRIRERFENNKRMEPAQVLDLSINETLSRTIMTSATTLIVVIVLLVLGGPVLQGFSTALIVGILVGTYSSIYIASASALDFGLKAEHVFPIEKKDPIDDLP
jgi:preprotein translocase subunit SecF